MTLQSDNSVSAKVSIQQQPNEHSREVNKLQIRSLLDYSFSIIKLFEMNFTFYTKRLASTLVICKLIKTESFTSL